jgi:hypothetical protein
MRDDPKLATFAEHGDGFAGLHLMGVLLVEQA